MAERRVLWAVNQAGTTLGCIANMLAVIVFVTACILIVFAILRDEKAFRIITPEEHKNNYLKATCDVAA